MPSTERRRSAGPHRRRFLKYVGTVGTTGVLAGCVGDDAEEPSADGQSADEGEPSDDGESDGIDDAGDADGPADEADDGTIEDRVAAAFDDLMTGYMDRKRIPTGAIGVASGGESVVRAGYGPAERDGDDSIDPGARFRIASVSKAFTAEAVRVLVDRGDLAFDERITGLLQVEPADGYGDERLHDVTVAHLLDHRGGWDDPPTADPMFDAFSVASALDLDAPPTKRDFARHLLSEPLDFEPGTDRAYSNFGYVLLGLGIEAATGTSYVEFVNEELLAPDGIEPVALARSRPEDRPRNEVWYDSPPQCPNAIDLEAGDLVRCADGGFVVEALDAAGGLIASVDTLLGFLDTAPLAFEPEIDPEPAHGPLFGLFTGTFAMAHQRADGVDVVTLFNSGVQDIDSIATAVDETIQELEGWP